MTEQMTEIPDVEISGTPAREQLLQSLCERLHREGWIDRPEPMPKGWEMVQRSRRSPKAKPVINERGEIFETSEVASASMGLEPSVVRTAIIRKGRSGGLRWWWLRYAPAWARRMGRKRQRFVA